MTRPRPGPNSRRGSAMLLALLVILAGSFVLAGWVMVMAAQVFFAEEAASAQKRHIAYANSRALAEQFILQFMATSPGVPAGSASLTDGWGEFTLATGMSGSWISLKSNAPPERLNPFSPGGALGYTVTLDTILSGSATRHFQIRSRSPLFGGYSFTIHQPVAAMPTGATIYTDTLTWPRKWGFAAPPLTSGETASGSYAGYLPQIPMLDLIGAPVTVTAGTAGITETISGQKRVVTVDLNTLNLEGFPSAPDAILIHYEVPSDKGSSGNLTGAQLILQGGGSDLPATLITFKAGAIGLESVQLTGTNARRIFLRVSNPIGAPTLILSGTGSWRLATTLLNAPCALNTGAGLTLTGGIRTNSAITISGGGLTLYWESNPGGLEGLADRIAWLESFEP